MKILLVEDDMALAMGTEYALRAEGYEVEVVGTVADAKTKSPEVYDLALLDIMLPDGTGYDVLEYIRNESRVPVIFLTAVGDEVNIVQGLDMGADDYVTKPYRVRELLSRISAILRRAESRDEVHFGRHRLNMNQFRLYDEKGMVDMSPVELRLLMALIRANGKALTRSELLEAIFDTGESFVDDNTLSVYMKRLRTKLGEDARHIETVRGTGYRFKIG